MKCCRFTDAASLLHFIEQRRERLIGKRICRITVHLENGSAFILSPADADAPGHMEILSADARRLPSEIPPKE